MPFGKRDSVFEHKKLKEILKDKKELAEYRRWKQELKFRIDLVSARKKSSLSQKDLAKKTGLSQQAISRIETGYSSTTIKNMLKYLNALGYTIKVVKDTK